MESTMSSVEILYERIKDYIETSIELYKLNSINTVADLISSVVSKLILIVVASVFILFLNISLSLYLGEQLGSSYLGFLVVSGFYFILSVLVFFVSKPMIKNSIADKVINKLTEDKNLDAEINEIIREDEEI